MNNMKLRVCLTDICNFNCKYCRPGGEGVLNDTTHLLTDEQLVELVHRLQDLGFEGIRLTGGEPLLRKNWAKIASEIKEHPSLSKLTMVTNGSLLTDKNISSICSIGFKSVTVSLDTVNSEHFYNLTGFNGGDRVIENILRLQSAGVNVKINAVIQKSNYSDVFLLIDFCCQHKLPLKLLDLVCMDRTYWNEEFIALNEIEERLSEIAEKKETQYQDEGKGTPEKVFWVKETKIVVKNSLDGTSYIEKCKKCPSYPCQSGIVSFILTTDGMLKLCSLNDIYNVDVKPLLEGDEQCVNRVKQIIADYQRAIFESRRWNR